jgi:hypothetical protein
MGKKDTTDERRRLNISMTEEEKEALEAQAAKEMRTVSGMAKVYILKGLAEAAKKADR